MCGEILQSENHAIDRRKSLIKSIKAAFIKGSIFSTQSTSALYINIAVVCSMTIKHVRIFWENVKMYRHLKINYGENMFQAAANVLSSKSILMKSCV